MSTEFEPGRRILKLTSIDPEKSEAVLKALDSVNRIRILHYLSDKTASVNDIAAALGLPTSTTASYVEILEQAGLIKSEFEPASRGLRKVCARMYDQIVLDMPVPGVPEEQAIELSMPVGAFVDCQVTPTCGLASESGPIGMFDDPASFYEPGRIEAQLVWFYQGYVEYRFPNRLPAHAQPEGLHLSLELCSEAPLYNLQWPSDITVWINGVKIGTWISPSDFGGERGLLTPEWWTPRNTQYGLLKMWHVSDRGSQIDGVPMSGVTIRDLNLQNGKFIAVRIGIAPDAEHVGGINIFGRRFGNYPQDIVLRIAYRAEVS